MGSLSDELGLDSLVLVDIHTGFMKDFQAGVPVLKIMGNDTMASLAQYAADNVPGEMVPCLEPS